MIRGFLFVFACLPWIPEPASGRPNVIVILADDQGSIDAGCYETREIRTPAIDRLAKEGIRFTQFYSAASICSPSRAGLLTGRYPWNAGLESNGPSGPSEKINDLRESRERGGVPGSQVTMAEVFGTAGYATAHIGKWHLGHGDGSRPLDQGFDYSFGHMGGCIDNWSHFYYWNGPNRHDLWENNRRVRMPGRFFPDLMVEKAAAFLEENRSRPFFMYFAINLPHYPYQGDPKWLEEYASLPYPLNLYASTVSTMDERIGALLGHVDRLGLKENTIVVFQSDHGHSTEERAHFGRGEVGPYRGAKFSLFEGGIRVPAIVSWPKHLPSGETRGVVAHGCDWLPTLASLCKVDLPKKVTLDGCDLKDVLRSAAAPSPHGVVKWRQGKQRAVREGPWKLIHWPNPADGRKLSEEDGEWFLSNLEEDPAEAVNQAGRHPEELNRLRALGEW